MLSQEENERLTRFGPGTPMGNLLRRYWQPVACSELVTSKPQRLKILGEELVIYRGASGAPVLMQLRCAHRSVALDYGRVEGDSIRCPYHGWLYDHTGLCVAQPAEAATTKYKNEIRIASYKTQEASGLVFAYMGPEPTPILPLYDVMRMEEGARQIFEWRGIAANWLQTVDNILDASHLSWLHGYTFPFFSKQKITYRWDRSDFGVNIVMAMENGNRDGSCYAFPGHNRFVLPPFAPNMPPMECLLFRVPVDDTTSVFFFLSVVPLPGQKSPIKATRTVLTPGQYKPLEEDWWGIDLADQDRMVIEQQGAVVDRTIEHLVATDAGILLMRRMMREALEAIEEGKDPPFVIRDPARQNIDLPVVHGEHLQMEQADQSFSADRLFSRPPSEPAE